MSYYEINYTEQLNQLLTLVNRSGPTRNKPAAEIRILSSERKSMNVSSSDWTAASLTFIDSLMSSFLT